MLNRLNVRTKLLVVVTPLIALLLGGAYVAVQPRLDEVGRRDDDQAMVEFVRRASELATGLQSESILSVASLGGSMNVSVELDAARVDNDARLDTYRRAYSAVAGLSADLDLAVAAQTERFETLARAREAIDGPTSAAMTLLARFDLLLDTFQPVRLIATRAVAEPQASQFAELASTLGESTEILGQIGRRGSTVIAGLTDLSNDLGVIAALDASHERVGEIFTSLAPAEYGTAYADAQTESVSEYGTLIFSLQTGAGPQVQAVTVERWVTAVTAVMAAESTIADQVLADANETAVDRREAASIAVRNFVGLAIVAIVVAIAGTVVVARSITRPLRRLTEAADSLATEQLPELVDRLRNPNQSFDDSAAPVAIEVTSKDELGQLAGSINAIQSVALQVANEQVETLRKGISDIFVNLARRNQTLLDRQIEFIDQLESSEEDPRALENLFRLDHLATRMRRNAESLLVLAGAEPPRRRGAAVPVVDVVRVAIGEVEEFARVNLLAIDDVEVAGNVAPDLAHLLSELMENATQFSPPTASVDIVGSREANGSYTITISDGGIGMTAEQLDAANELIAQPPVIGLSLQRSLGFVVVGRLAQRFGLAVELLPGRSGGLTACIHLPPTVLGATRSVVDSSPTDFYREEIPSTVPAEWLSDASTPTPTWTPDSPPAWVSPAQPDRSSESSSGPTWTTSSAPPVPAATDWASESSAAAWATSPTPATWSPEPAPAAWSSEPTPPPAQWTPEPAPAAWTPEPAPPPAQWAPAPMTPPASQPPAAWSPVPAAPAASAPPPPTLPTVAARPATWTPPPNASPPAAPGATSVSASQPLEPWSPSPRPAQLADLAPFTGSSHPPASSPPPAPPTVSQTLSPWGSPPPVEQSPASTAPTTRSGLAKRVPGKTLDSDEVSGPAAAQSKRSPEDVRKMLSRYRSGLHQGRDGER